MHDVDDYPDAETLPGLVVYRYDAPLFFANVGDMRRRALLAVDQENAALPEHPVRWFILNVEANVEVDITAADGLRDLHDDLAARGVRLALARVKTDLRIPLERAGLADLIGEDMLFPTLPVAEEAYLSWAASNPERDRGRRRVIACRDRRGLDVCRRPRDPAQWRSGSCPLAANRTAQRWPTGLPALKFVAASRDPLTPDAARMSPAKSTV